MIRIVIALLFVQAFFCAEFPDLNNHIKLTWNDVSLDQKFNSNQTVSDADGSVNNFILCAAFNNSAHGGCFYDFTLAEYSSFNITISGSGNFTTNVVSQVNETYSCLEFFNPVYGDEQDGAFQKIYRETLVGKGSWEVKYSCGKSVGPDKKDYTWFIVIGVIVAALVIIGAICGVMYSKKKKAEGEVMTDSTRAGLLLNK